MLVLQSLWNQTLGTWMDNNATY